VDRDQSNAMPRSPGPQPNRIGPVPFGSVDQKDRFITGLSAIFSILIKFYYLLNKTNYIHTLQAVARSGGVLMLRDRKKERKKNRMRKKKQPHRLTFVARVGGWCLVPASHSPLVIVILPASRCCPPCYLSLSSPLVVIVVPASRHCCPC
jgi:hypothetical protein